MKRSIALLLVASSLAFAQAVPAKPKHPKFAKFKHAAKTTAEVAGGVAILGIVIVGAGGANVKVY